MHGNRHGDKPLPPAKAENPAKELQGKLQTNNDPNIGKLVDGRYRVRELLGQGGMGKVYLADDNVTGEQVAVKVIKTVEGTPDEIKAANDRFIREAQALAKVKDCHVLDIKHIGEFGNTPYCVTEYLPGKDMGKVLKSLRAQGKPMDQKRFINLVKQICSGVQAAHETGLMHRDLKPGNIMVMEGDTKERVKLLDFGLAKFVATDRNVHNTRTGMLMGTIAYMAPEQLKSNKYDHRVDIYSLGVIMYEMYTGTVPFTGETDLEVITHHLSTAPEPPSKLRPMSRQLEEVIMRCLEKEPDKRFQSVRELLAAITKDENGTPRLSEQPELRGDSLYYAAGGSARRKGNVFGKVVGGILLTAALIGGAWTYFNWDRVQKEAQSAIDTVKGRLAEGEQEGQIAPQPLPKPVDVEDTYFVKIETKPEAVWVFEEMPDGTEKPIAKTPFEFSVEKGEHKFLIKGGKINHKNYDKARFTLSEANPHASIRLKQKTVEKKQTENDAAPVIIINADTDNGQ